MVAEPASNPERRNILLKQYLRDQLIQFDPSTNILDLSDRPELWYSDENQAQIVQTTTPRDYTGLDEIVGRFAEQIKKPVLSVVDYGCGDGLKGIHVHNFLQAEGRLFQVDHSKDMLALAGRNAEQEGVSARGILADLDISHDISRKIRDNAPRFHLFLGQTIGNPRQPQYFTESIASSMRKGEYLLLEWFKRTKEYYEGRREFVSGYISTLGIPQEHFMKDDGELDYFVDEESDPQWFKCCLRVHKEFVHKETGKTIPAGSVVIATRSRRFEEDEVISLFQQQGLEAHVLHEWHEGQISEGGDVPEPVATKQQRWHEHGEYRYALFRKVKEGRPLLRWLLATSLASVAMAGGIYFNFFYNPKEIAKGLLRKDAPCLVERIVERDLKLICSTPEESTKEFDIRKIKQETFGFTAKEDETGTVYSIMSRNARHIEVILSYQEILRTLNGERPLEFPVGSYYPAFIEGVKSCLRDDAQGVYIQSIILAKKLEERGFPHPRALLEPIQELVCSDQQQAGLLIERVSQDAFFRFLDRLGNEPYVPLLDSSRREGDYNNFRDLIRVTMQLRSTSLWNQVYTALYRSVYGHSINFSGDDKEVAKARFVTAAMAFTNITRLLNLGLPEDYVIRVFQISNHIDHDLVALNFIGAMTSVAAELKRFEKPAIHYDIEALKKSGMVRQEGNKAYVNLDAIAREHKFWDNYPQYKQETLDFVLDELERYKDGHSEKQVQVALASLMFWTVNFSTENDDIRNFLWMQALRIYITTLNQFDCLSKEIESRYNPKTNELSEYVASRAQKIYVAIRDRTTTTQFTPSLLCAE